MSELNNTETLHAAQKYVDVIDCADLEFINFELARQEFSEIFRKRSQEWFGPFHRDTLRSTVKVGAQAIHTLGVFVCLAPIVLLRREKFRQAIDNNQANVIEAQDFIAGETK